MKLRLTAKRSYPAAPVTVFDFTNDARNFGTFVGFGIVPGIREARYETAGEPALGSKRRVRKTDGTEHVEEIIVFQRPFIHVARISGLSPPLSWLVQEAEDAWSFSGTNHDTHVLRTFVLQLRSPLWFPIAFTLMHVFLRVALARDLANVGRALEGRAA